MGWEEGGGLADSTCPWQALIKLGARVDLRTVRLVIRQRASKSLVLLQVLQQDTDLNVACKFGQVERARLLLAEGADPTLVDVYHWTPLMWAVGNLEVGGCH